MSDEFDRAIDRLTLDQRKALASILSSAMALDSIREKATQKPSEIAFTRSVSDLFKNDGGWNG